MGERKIKKDLIGSDLGVYSQHFCFYEIFAFVLDKTDITMVLLSLPERKNEPRRKVVAGCGLGVAGWRKNAGASVADGYC